MKKIIYLIILVFIVTNLQAQVNKNIQNDNSQRKLENSNIVYQLYPTQNMWTFLKLNTRNGKISQVHFDIKGNNRVEVELNSISLVTNEKETNGKFTLYPTQNIYNFILLDQTEGKIWQVQWSMEIENRSIIPIEN